MRLRNSRALAALDGPSGLRKGPRTRFPALKITERRGAQSCGRRAFWVLLGERRKWGFGKVEIAGFHHPRPCGAEGRGGGVVTQMRGAGRGCRLLLQPASNSKTIFVVKRMVAGVRQGFGQIFSLSPRASCLETCCLGHPAAGSDRFSFQSYRNRWRRWNLALEVGWGRSGGGVGEEWGVGWGRSGGGRGRGCRRPAPKRELSVCCDRSHRVWDQNSLQ